MCYTIFKKIYIFHTFVSEGALGSIAISYCLFLGHLAQFRSH